MIGSQFDGIVEQINYHSQHGITNSSGTWYRMEMDDWTPQVQASVSVKVDILVVFPLGNTTKRPAGFNVTETVGTNAPFSRPFIANP